LKNFSSLLFVALVANVTAGCRCGTATTSLKPDYLTPGSVSFEACPSRDEAGNPVADVFGTRGVVSIQNQGKAAGQLLATITGSDGAAFAIAPGAPTTVGPLALVDVPLTPARKGALTAQLEVDDGEGGHSTVQLKGLGKDLPARPRLETAPQTGPATFSTCQDGSPLFDCTLQFPDTLFNQSSTLTLKLRNTGCPTLKITDLAIESTRGDTQGFTIDSPALPSVGAPLLLNTADGTNELAVTVRFTPTDDNTGNLGRLAALVITSNDAMYGDGAAGPARLSLEGQATKPSLSGAPNGCDLANALDPCGYATAQQPHDRARFVITNEGNTALVVSKVSFASTGTSSSADGRFTVAQNVEGQTLAPSASATLEVLHQEQPVYVTDHLDVVADIPGQGPGSGGMTSVSIAGGKKPCLTPSPRDQLDFMNPQTELSTRTIAISNGAGCGGLVLRAIAVDPNPFFSLIAPLIAENTMVAAGAQVEATVQFHRPVSGGAQLATLRLQSNDPDFAPPQGKGVQLYSQAPLDLLPTAALTACGPTALTTDPTCTKGVTSHFSARLSALSPPEVVLSGVNSTDDTSVAEYRFTLLNFPAGVTTAALRSSGVRGTVNQTVLTVPPAGTGTYRVQLEVWDNRGQRSGIAAAIDLNLYP
jgi:hypothetical protein